MSDSAKGKNKKKRDTARIRRFLGKGAAGISAAVAFILQNYSVEDAKNMLEKLGIDGEFHVGPTKIKVGLKPSPTNIPGSSGDDVPVSEDRAVVQTSGYNGNYTARCHKINFTAGAEPSKAVKTLARINGNTKMRVMDTRFSSQTGAARQQLTKTFGFNQKLVTFFRTYAFGYGPEDILNKIDLTGYETSSIMNQTSYLALTKFRSIMTINNNNKAVPIKFSFKIIRQKEDVWEFQDLLGKSTNISTTVQEMGTIPILRQFTGASSDTWGTSLYVDPESAGLYSCGNSINNFEIVKSMTVKLMAGDSMELTYDHLCGPGLRLEELAQMPTNSTHSIRSAYTYGLAMEAHGVPVEISSHNGTEKMRGTSSGEFNIEFKKFIYGAKPSGSYLEAIDTAAVKKGFHAKDFAIRVFTRTPSTETVIKKMNVMYNKIVQGPSGTAGEYYIPLLSDKTVIYTGDKE